MSDSIGTIVAGEHRPDGTVAIRLVLPRLPSYPINIGDKYILYPNATPPRDTYDLAAQVWQNVMNMQWSIQAVADAIEKLYEAREAAKALETRP